MNSYRGGKFEIDANLIDRAPKAVLAILKGCIVTRAEHMFHSQRIEYVARGEHFDAVPWCEELPWYDVEVKDLKPGEYLVTWKRRGDR
jgi:hypothetical protein